MTYRYIYKITCTAGSFKDKFYFGQRTTYINPSKDKYKGSGVLIRRYLKKYPDKYIKEIISFHNSKEELNQAEYNIIHPNLNNPMCLNLMEGGKGGALSEISIKKMSESKKGKPSWNKGKTGIYSKETIDKFKNAPKSNQYIKAKQNGITLTISEETRKKLGEAFKGKHHTQEVKNIISETVKHLIWVTKEDHHKRICIHELQKYIDAGWHKGRK